MKKLALVTALVVLGCDGEEVEGGGRALEAADVVITPLPSADVNCPFGGSAISLDGGRTVTHFACNGADGEVGLRGLEGPTGPEGPEGLVGAQGPEGLVGAQGPQGSAAPSNVGHALLHRDSAAGSNLEGSSVTLPEVVSFIELNADEKYVVTVSYAVAVRDGSVSCEVAQEGNSFNLDFAHTRVATLPIVGMDQSINVLFDPSLDLRYPPNLELRCHETGDTSGLGPPGGGSVGRVRWLVLTADSTTVTR